MSELSESKPTSRFPRTIVTASREEFLNPITLTVRDAEGNEAKLPEDLHGFLFLLVPAGSPDSPTVGEDKQVVWTAKNGWTSLYNGDGMVYRLDFQGSGASLKTRFIKPPCYYADVATSDRNRFEDLKFSSAGPARISLNKLGTRNQVNTAFIPFKLHDDKSDRLLVAWDAGRPYEIDPETLETLTPVGKNKEWQDVWSGQPALPFKNVMTSAHPVFDKDTGELFTVNVGKSTGTLFDLSRAIEARSLENSRALESSSNSSKMQTNLLRLYGLILGLLELLLGFLGLLGKGLKFFGGESNFVHLLAWDGKKVEIERKWNVVLAGNKPLRIGQTIHHLGITQDYILFAETSLKFTLEHSLPYLRDPLASAFLTFLANFVNYPQYPSSKLYIVKKADLKSTAQSGDRSKNLPQVIAKEVEIAPEFSYFLVDYANTDDRIIVYPSHIPATDVSEFIRIFDRSAFNDLDFADKPDEYNDPQLTARLRQLAGNAVGPLDISRLGRWTIEGETGKIIEKQLFPSDRDRETIEEQLANNSLSKQFQLTWATAFYAYRDLHPTEKLTDIFWNSWGASPDTLTTRTVKSYRNYPHRLVNLNRVIDLTYKGIPSSICHLKIRTDDRDRTAIEVDTDNYYQFDNSYLGTSVQFLPRLDAKDATDGYIACVVLTSDELLSQSHAEDNDPEWSQNSEIWLFDARKLNCGPLYKLSHPRLNIGASFRTVWLAEAKSPNRKLDYDVREDYEYLVRQLIKDRSDLKDEIRQLFDREIYPNFENG